mgnify:CR=1 FL=1|tara:strand:+ start:10 stop:420 length:411 start_codon:yes stop_codon:yes gene_type:complete
MKVIEIKNNSFDKDLIKKYLEKKMCFIGIFSKDCFHCTNMKPEWKILKKKLKKINTNTLFLEIDANYLNKIDVSSLKNSIDGFPSIMIFKNGKKIKDYSGDRSSNNMLNFFKGYMTTLNKKTKKAKKTKKNKTKSI